MSTEKGCFVSNVTPDMVNAAWNKAKDLRMTGLPSDYRQVLEAALEASRSPVSQKAETWTCATRNQGTAGGNDPADCDWPVCGCDPYADKVIAALQETGLLAPVSQKEAVPVCKHCKGTGAEADWVGLEMHCVAVACSACGGSGHLPAPTPAGEPAVTRDAILAQLRRMERDGMLAVYADADGRGFYLDEYADLFMAVRSALHPSPTPVSAPVGENETIALLREVRTWIGDGENADDLGREIWTDAYADIVDRVDDVLARSPAVVEGK